MDLKEQLLSKAMRLMQDPRVAQGVMSAIQLRAKLEQRLEQGARVVAKRLNLATGAEVRELRRTVGRLERELEAARKAPDTSNGHNA